MFSTKGHILNIKAHFLITNLASGILFYKKGACLRFLTLQRTGGEGEGGCGIPGG